MRIITGKARGLQLKTPKDYNVRPTADRVKESLFNILGTRVRDAQVWDAFAGTGNLGLECWSRGAQRVLFTDASPVSLKLVESNVLKAKASNECTLLKGDATKLVERLHQQGQEFDLIFSDPPYNKGWNEKLLEGLLRYPLLKKGGLLILEYSKVEGLLELPAQLDQVRTEKYGDTFISLILWK